MLKAWIVIIGLLVSFVAPQASAAAWEKQKATEYRLPDPPDEAATALEIDQLLKLQDERTDAECSLGQKQRFPGFVALFSGTFVPAEDIRTLSPLMKRVTKLGEKISAHFKSHYNRTRPYDVDSRLKPCVTVPGGQKSYPSSHAAISTLDACVLAVIYEDTRTQNALQKLSNELGERRMKIGVHFPSDVKAGQDLGLMICYNLRNNSEFMTEVEAARRAL